MCMTGAPLVSPVPTVLAHVSNPLTWACASLRVYIATSERWIIQMGNGYRLSGDPLGEFGVQRWMPWEDGLYFEAGSYRCGRVVVPGIDDAFCVNGSKGG